MITVAWALVACLLAVICVIEGKNVSLFMPGVQPQKDDTYLCHSIKITGTQYITGFIPHAKADTAHHILLYGCEEPGAHEPVWNCGEMMSTTEEKVAGTCARGGKILYAWAMDAKALKLPEGVGFKVGDGTDNKYLTLQVHYKSVKKFVGPNAIKDRSGLALVMTPKPVHRLAGVYLLGTGGYLPAHTKKVYMEAACTYNGKTPIHPFAYRVHAHTHGEVVSGYKINKEGNWIEIGRNSPKKPQMFYNTTHQNMVVNPGDVLAARCTMKNDEDRDVPIGATQKDEMCNFYIMYYVENGDLPKETICFTAGPPNWSWANFNKNILPGMPKDVSLVPGAKDILKATEDVAEETDRLLDFIYKKIKEQEYNYDSLYPDEREYDDLY